MPEPGESDIFLEHLRDISHRTAQALATTGFDGLLLQAGDPTPYFLDDQSYPFRAHPPFRRWVPLADTAGSFLYFEPGHRPRLIFHKAADFWHKSTDLPAAPWVDAFDIRMVKEAAGTRAMLPASLERVAYLGQPFADLQRWNVGALNPQPLVNRLDHDRATKTAYEIACLQEANRIGARGHLAAAAAFHDDGSEFEIHQSFLRACVQREQELPYNAIVALNSAGATLHYQHLSRRPPPHHRSLLIDAGASFAGYGSDITRTWTKHSPDFQALIDGMDALQQQLCSLVRPGADWRDIHLAAVRLIARLLRNSGLVRCQEDQAIDTGIATRFFPHGIGHLLGLQVHDVGGTLAGPEGGDIARPPGHPTLRLTRTLETGFVVTMEPGLYFIDALLKPLRSGPETGLVDWALVDALRPFGGIRIEDDLVVKPEAALNLTRIALAEAAG